MCARRDPGGVDRRERALERASSSVGKPTITSVVTFTCGAAARTAAIRSHVLGRGVVAAHRASTPSSPDCIGTWRCGHTFGSVASASSSESLTWITSTLESRTRSTPGTARDRDHQLAELEPPLGVAVVADADPRHHHLRLALRDAPTHLVAAPRSPAASARARGPSG